MLIWNILSLDPVPEDDHAVEVVAAVGVDPVVPQKADHGEDMFYIRCFTIDSVLDIFNNTF